MKLSDPLMRVILTFRKISEIKDQCDEINFDLEHDHEINPEEISNLVALAQELNELYKHEDLEEIGHENDNGQI